MVASAYTETDFISELLGLRPTFKMFKDNVPKSDSIKETMVFYIHSNRIISYNVI